MTKMRRPVPRRRRALQELVRRKRALDEQIRNLQAELVKLRHEDFQGRPPGYGREYRMEIDREIDEAFPHMLYEHICEEGGYREPHPWLAYCLLRAFETEYLRSGNPAWVWRALLDSIPLLATGKPLPAWILRYLWNAGVAMLEEAAERPALHVLKALEFHISPGRNDLAELHRGLTDLVRGHKLRLFMEMRGQRAKPAAKELGASSHAEHTYVIGEFRFRDYLDRIYESSRRPRKPKPLTKPKKNSRKRPL